MDAGVNAHDPTRALLDAAFPFHLVVDRDLVVDGVGRSMARLAPHVARGTVLTDHLQLIAPPQPLTGDTLDALQGSLTLFALLGSEVILRCQVIPAARERRAELLALLISPWVTDPSHLEQLGLHLSDFAPHDPTPDFAILAQAQATAMADVRRLADRLQEIEAERVRLAEAERALARDLDALPDLLLRLDRNGVILDDRCSGRHAGGGPLVGVEAGASFPELADHLIGALHRAFASGTTQSFDTERHLNGVPSYLEARVVRCSDDEALLLIRDVTERRSLEIQLAYQAFHDSLTGLANRDLFIDRLNQVMLRRDGRSWIGVLFVDLDDFKLVNDTRGHSAGDALLIEVSERLQATVREADTVARFGGDEFAVLVECEGVGGPVEAARRIVRALQQPIASAGVEFQVGASVGVVVVSDRSVGAEELLRRADVAMYQAKAAGKNGVAVYRPGMDAELTRDGRMRH
jgi:diguanylate cyclase (GGDEF)-like protein